MRDIKFRAWDNHKKQMICEGYHVIGEVTIFGLIDRYVQENRGEIPSLEYYSYIIESQYTGLKDKNGKEIYEGDILRSPHFVDSKEKQYWLYHEIMWDEKHTGWKAVSLNNAEGKEITAHGNPQLFVYMKNEGAAEVYGNIYENPELIK